MKELWVGSPAVNPSLISCVRDVGTSGQAVEAAGLTGLGENPFERFGH